MSLREHQASIIHENKVEGRFSATISRQRSVVLERISPTAITRVYFFTPSPGPPKKLVAKNAARPAVAALPVEHYMTLETYFTETGIGL
ncbi:MAG: hypothetical protein HQM09_16900 [Candidatus Riflebacteria bacterium]|nr:hypothetical protein [Candidatus Riflebacteria bacterium]